MSNLKRFLALTLAMLMVVGAMAVSAKSFTDVASTDSYAEAVDVLSELGVILGTSTDEFSPEALVSREQMAMFIARLATAQPALFAGEAGAIFKDQKDPTYNAAIQYAYTNGIIAGRTATEFDGPASVTLQEAAAMLSRALGYGNKSNNASYPFSYMVIANEINLLKGLEEIAPTAELTRGEVATMLYNALSAPKAVRTLLYTPDGQDFVVSIPDGFYGVKDDDGNVLPFDTLATKAWKFKNIASYVVSTKDIGFTVAPAKATKTLTDPVILKDYNDGKAVSFASIAKFLPEDAVANDLVGVDLTILAKGTKIIKIDVIGDVTTTTTASYDDADGKKLVTVDGTKYDLANYFDGTYPSESDNCFYYLKDNSIVKFVASDVAKLADIKLGFFSIDVINAGKDTQKIVFKPYSFSQVTKNAAGQLVVDGSKVITSANGAVADDYVVFFNGGDKHVNVIAIATKTTASKLVAKNTANKVGTLESGLKIPFNTSTINNSQLLGDVTIGGSYYAYVVNGVVLKTVDANYTTAYQPKSYARILNFTGNDFDGYRAKVLTNSGAETTVTITKVNGTAITAGAWTEVSAGVDVEDRTVGSSVNNIASVGDTIVLDGGNIITATIYDADTTTQVANAAFKSETTDAFISTGTVTADGSSIIDLNSAADVVLTDFTRVIVNNSGTYSLFTGKSFKGITGDTSSTYAAVYRNIAGVKELVYLYVEGAPASVTETGTLYLFVSKGDETATTVSYNAINLATGAAEVVTFTDAAGTSTIGAYKTGASALVYDVKSGASKPTAVNSTAVKYNVYANGYAVTTTPSATYSLTNAKYYVWENNTYVAKTLDAMNKAIVHSGDIIADTSNNAKYVVSNAQAQSALVSGDVTPTVTGTTTKTAKLAVAGSPAKIYYSLDGGTTYIEYTSAGFTVTATITIKVKAEFTGYTVSEPVDVVVTVA